MLLASPKTCLRHCIARGASRTIALYVSGPDCSNMSLLLTVTSLALSRSRASSARHVSLAVCDSASKMAYAASVPEGPASSPPARGQTMANAVRRYQAASRSGNHWLRSQKWVRPTSDRT